MFLWILTHWLSRSFWPSWRKASIYFFFKKKFDLLPFSYCYYLCLFHLVQTDREFLHRCYQLRLVVCENMSVWMCVCVYVCECVYVWICICRYVYVYLCECVYICICVCMCVCMWIASKSLWHHRYSYAAYYARDFRIHQYMPLIPRTQLAKTEDFHEFKAHVRYIVSSRLSYKMRP